MLAFSWVLGNTGGLPCNHKSCFHVIEKHCSFLPTVLQLKPCFLVKPHLSDHIILIRTNFSNMSIPQECIIPILLLISRSQNNIFKWNPCLTVSAVFYILQMIERITHVTLWTWVPTPKYLVLIWNSCRWYYLILASCF